MRLEDYDIIDEEGIGSRRKPIEPKKTIKKSLIKVLLSTKVIIISTLAMCYFIAPTIANYVIANSDLSRGKSKVQIEREFNSLKDSKEYPFLGKVADSLFNNSPQKSGRDIAYYLGNKSKWHKH